MMNSNRRAEVKKLLAKDPTLSPKQAYDAVKLLKLKGKRKADKNEVAKV